VANVEDYILHYCKESSLIQDLMLILTSIF